MGSFLDELDRYLANEDENNVLDYDSDENVIPATVNNDENELIYSSQGEPLVPVKTSKNKYISEIQGSSRKRQKLSEFAFQDPDNSYNYQSYDPRSALTANKTESSSSYTTPATTAKSSSFRDQNQYAIKNNYLLTAPGHQVEGTKTTNNKQKISVNVLPDKLRSIFQFSHFNQMQSEAFNAIFNNYTNCILSSPTGSGKTVLFELAILKLYIDNQNFGGSDSRNYKILYMAPTKALCTERYQDWVKKFVPLNLTVGLLTSDTSLLETDNVRKSDIIICTPEKWDLLTRRWSDYSRLFELVKLLLIDEVHILKEKRGSTLEVVVTRMKRLCEYLRIIGISATLPNIIDVAKWIKQEHASPNSAMCLNFGEEYRSVKLKKYVYGFKSNTTNDFQFETFLNSKVLESIRKHFLGKPVLVFCSTRAASVATAKYLNQNCYGLFRDLNQKQMFYPKDRELSEMMSNGIAFHHAGLSFEDRQIVEKNFLSGATKVLCSTSTLAVGVNLPAYLVIIKGTKCWLEAGLTEYSDLDISQMIGRAGRPQFEKEGCAVVLTRASTAAKYERIVQGTEKLESSLHLNFVENLAAEITLKTIDSVESAVDWLKSTFFYTRYMQNPTAYNEVKELRHGCTDVRERLTKFCHEKLNDLLKERLVIETERKFESTPYCESMSRHYVAFQTMKNFMHVKFGNDFKAILELVSQSYEFRELHLKNAEKKLFKEIASSVLLKYSKDTKALASFEDKVFLLLQYELGGLEFPNYSGSLKLHSVFINDKNFIFKQLPRIVKCMVDVFAEKKDARSLLNALKLARCVNGRCWEDSVMVLRQLQGIGLAYVRKFANHNIYTLQQVGALQGSEIEYYLGLKNNGANIKKQAAGLPKLDIRMQMVNEKISHDLHHLEVDLKITVLVEQQGTNSWKGKFLVVDIVTEVNNRNLVDFRRIPIAKIHESNSFNITVQLTRASDDVSAHVHCFEIAGIGKNCRFDISQVSLKNFGKLIPIPAKKKHEDYDDHDQPQKTEISEETNELSTIFEKQDEFDDDDDLDMFVKEQLPDSSTILPPTKPYQLRRDGKYECNHSCKVKSSCRHICCKEGLLKNPAEVKRSSGCNHNCKDKSKCRHLCCREALLGLQKVNDQADELHQDIENEQQQPVSIVSVVSPPQQATPKVRLAKMKKLSIPVKHNVILDSDSDGLSGNEGEQLDMQSAIEKFLQIRKSEEFIPTSVEEVPGEGKLSPPPPPPISALIESCHDSSSNKEDSLLNFLASDIEIA